MLGKKSGIPYFHGPKLDSSLFESRGIELLQNANILKIMLKTLSGANLKNLGKRAHFLERAL